ncbi:MAG TPA: hypothetical protein VGL89_05320 [Candidatus Koribacter sp.]
MPTGKLLVVEDKGRKDDVLQWQVKHWLRVEKELNAAADAGFAMAMRPVIVTTTNFALTEFTEYFYAPMETVRSGAKPHYKTVQANSLPLLSQMVNKAEADGWTMVPGALYGDQVAILEQEVKP